MNIYRDCCRSILLILLCIYCHTAHAQTYECITCKHTGAIQKIKPYAAFIHQHQDFFGKTFSFQNAEAGIAINNTFHIGIYGGLFASNLRATVGTQYMYITARQAGITFSKVANANKLLHTGYSISAGYFSLIAGNEQLSPFKNAGTGINIYGLTLSPQVFAELNITHWLSFRPGLSYNFYSFETKNNISVNDLQNIALNFGFYIHHAPHVSPVQTLAK